MQICGFNKTTLLDYPGHVAATVFTGCCNFRCPFCQNGDLVLHPGQLPALDEEEIFRVLKKIKDLGYLVKLDTNGYLPDVVEGLVREGLLDYIAMDIKSSPEHYADAAGFPGLRMEPVFRSVSFLRGCGLPFEFRTTVVKGLHDAEDFRSIGRWLAGPQPYFLQSYQESAGVISPVFEAVSKEELEGFRSLLLPFLPPASLRGVD